MPRLRGVARSVGRFTSRKPGTNPYLSDAEANSDVTYVIEKTGEDEDPADKKTLKVKGVDLNIDANTRAHSTDEFDVTHSEDGPTTKEYLVLRRGQAADFTIRLNRKYDPAKDDMHIVCDFGDDPMATPESHVDFILSKKDVKKQWGGWVTSNNDDSVSISVVSAVNCYVGKWFLRIDVVEKKDETKTVHRYPVDDPIYILFNPFHRDDGVYMHDKAERDEYVMAEKGIVYRGSVGRPSGMHWVFGQYSGNVLACCLYLLDENMRTRYRGDPVAVCRKISQLANANDEGGLIVGNWSGKYDGGVAPWRWTGSPEIYEQFYANKTPVKAEVQSFDPFGTPYKYGQCWVFSALVVTFARALGIPCRSVTNFASAHDTDNSLTLDTYLDSGYEEIEYRNNDSVWNFHVWNECWMARPDLPDGHGGWQIVDATPQEESGGVMACGPMSLVALRNGEVHQSYDGPFIFSEFNGDRNYYVEKKDGEMELVHVDKSSIGKKISTKAVGSDEREDLTLKYKHAEGSEEERMVMTRAKMNISELDRWITDIIRDVIYKFEVDEDSLFVGQDLKVKLLMYNGGLEPRTVSGQWGVDSTYYTGVPCGKIKREKITDVVVAPESEQSVEMTIGPDEYFPRLTDHCNVKLTACCIVKETEFTHFDTKPIRFRKPPLTCKTESTAKKGEKLSVKVSFQNPLDMTLTGCELVVEGHGLIIPTVYKQGKVDPKSTYVGSFDVFPSKLGKRNLVMIFNCDQVASIIGSQAVNVSE